MARPRTLVRRSKRRPRVPDRSLTAEEPLVTMAIRAAGTHQFVYRKMLEGPVGAAAPNHGDIVRVVDRDGVQLGYALWNGRSQISLRFLSRQEHTAGPRVLERRASTRRSPCEPTVLGLDRETNAYRVIHAEGDGLSGLIVDRYDDVLSVQIFSLGMYQRIGPILALIAERLGTAHFRVDVDERVAQQEDFSGRPLGQPAAPAPRHRAPSTESATAFTSKRGTRPASSAISATTAARSPGSAPAGRCSTSALTPAASA